MSKIGFRHVLPYFNPAVFKKKFQMGASAHLEMCNDLNGSQNTHSEKWSLQKRESDILLSPVGLLRLLHDHLDVAVFCGYDFELVL